MSDRIVLLDHGRVVQEGPPEIIYERPKTRFVADFMGFENIFEGELERFEEGTAVIRLSGSNLHGLWCGDSSPKIGGRVFGAVRAQMVHLGICPSDPKSSLNSVSCKVSTRVYKGKYADLILESPLGQITARIWDLHREFLRPENVWWRKKDCVIGPIG